MGVASFTVACGCAQQKQQSLYRCAKRRADASVPSEKKMARQLAGRTEQTTMASR
jgi:hypothetical protein